jgi:hypothetical protein
VPLVTHHSSSTIPLDPANPRLEHSEDPTADLGCPACLRPGDVCAP